MQKRTASQPPTPSSHTRTAGNSTPLSDGASSVLLASEEWAAAHGIPVQAYFTEAQTAGVECRKDRGIIDEIPAAYKDIGSVMANSSDMVEVVAELKQLLCVKR